MRNNFSALFVWGRTRQWKTNVPPSFRLGCLIFCSSIFFPLFFFPSFFSPSLSQRRRFSKKNGHLQSSVAQISQTGYRDESFRPLSNPGAEESFILGIHPLLSFIYARRKCFVFIFPSILFRELN